MLFRRKNIRLHPTRYRGRAWFFITLCCEARTPVFSNNENSQKLIDCLQLASEKYHFAIHAYCVMPDHFHALAEGLSPESDLLLFVRYFKQKTTRQHSKESGLPLWQKKFHDHILRPEDAPEAVAWYIWMNPIRKGLCTQPNQYTLSGSFTQQYQKKIQPKDQWAPAWKIS